MGVVAFGGSRSSALEGKFEVPHASGDVDQAVRYVWRMGERSRLEM